MKNIFWVFLFIFSLSDNVFADVIFSCQTKNNKIIKVTREGDYLFYSFGDDIKIKQKININEFVISKPVGANIVTSIPIKHDNYTYEVFTSTDRMNDLHNSTSGVFVYKGEGFLSRIMCLDKSRKGNLLNILE